MAIKTPGIKACFWKGVKKNMIEVIIKPDIMLYKEALDVPFFQVKPPITAGIKQKSMKVANN